MLQMNKQLLFNVKWDNKPVIAYRSKLLYTQITDLFSRMANNENCVAAISDVQSKAPTLQDWIEQGLTPPPTHYREYMTKSSEPEHNGQFI